MKRRGFLSAVLVAPMAVLGISGAAPAAAISGGKMDWAGWAATNRESLANPEGWQEMADKMEDVMFGEVQ